MAEAVLLLGISINMMTGVLGEVVQDLGILGDSAVALRES